MEISGLNIFVMEIESTIKISDLGVTNSSLHYEGATGKGSIVDNNNVRSTSFGISGLKGISSNLHYDRHPRCHQGTFKGSPTYFFL